MLEANEQRLVDVAKRIVRSLPAGEIHTVAAAAMDVNGDIHTGVNVFHFTGGPCAELVAIGAAAGAGAEPLISIVAVADGERGVISPCGRCRQVLLDLHPDVYAIVPIDGELQSRPICDLLPSSYRRAEAAPRLRVVYFHPRYFDSIVAGRKTATVRYRDPLHVGPAVFVFDDGYTIRRLDGDVKHVKARKVAQLTDEDAHREDLDNRQSLLDALAEHYPGLHDDDLIDVVTFEIAKR
jgi:cytidine deaminase